MGKKAKTTIQYDEEEKRVRVAVVDAERCRPNKCNQECKRSCSVNAQGKLCVEVSRDSRTSAISESLCNGCGICVKRCPLNAIQVINLPSNLSKDTTHRHGPNGFKLHRLPLPRRGRVLGLLGTNGIGKSTAMHILSGRLKPNLGDHQNPPDWKSVVANFRGSELQTYFNAFLEDQVKTAIKPQYVERFAELLKIPPHATVRDALALKDEKNISATISEELDLAHLLGREVSQLSGGELQRLAIATLCVQEADVYLVDEPSAYLDIRQRIRAAKTIRAALGETTYVVVVEHDLAVLDYVSDLVCCLWGSPGAYGAVTAPSGSSEGINHFLDGFIPSENMRIRDEPLTFRTAKDREENVTEQLHSTQYPSMQKTLPGFELCIDSGSFANSEVIVMLGENGTGKTTFIKMLKQSLEGVGAATEDSSKLTVACKPQHVVPSYKGTVRELLLEKINKEFLNPQFQSDVVKPMNVDKLYDLDILNLSGGQLQSVALVLTLGKTADIYLIDEPSAYLDVEQRIAAARVIRRFILNQQKTAFVVEHDFIMAMYLADRVIVFDGQPGVQCHASSAMCLADGMNKFLSQLGITFRAGRNGRPRINKLGGVRDREQKQSRNYFFAEQC